MKFKNNFVVGALINLAMGILALFFDYPFWGGWSFASAFYCVIVAVITRRKRRLVLAYPLPPLHRDARN